MELSLFGVIWRLTGARGSPLRLNCRVIFSAYLVLVLGFGCAIANATPRVESWTNANGAKVMYAYAPDLPMIDVRVVFDAGSARDGDLPGLAAFTNAALDQGAGPWSTDQIAERLADHGIDMGNGSLRDMAWYSVRSLIEPDTLDIAIETLATVISQPNFAAQEINRIRQQMQVGLRSALQSPEEVADRLFYKTVYAGHPYGHDPSGDPESLSRITVQRLRDFHAKYYVARNAVIAIVGAVDRAHAHTLADRLTEKLPRGEPAPALPSVPSSNEKTITRNFPSSQTHLLVGQPGMARHDPDYFLLYVGNHVLGGGGLVSILGEEVRNKRGLSYSVYSYFSPMRVAGPFTMGAQTKNDQAAQTLSVMRETLERFIREGPTAEELVDAKSNITGGFPLKVARNSSIVEYIAMMGFYDYPLDWLDTLVDKVEKVTVDAVRDAFARRVDPRRLVAVVVGGKPRLSSAGQAQ